MESVYVMSAQTAYVDKTRRNETADLWHARLGHLSYLKLKAMMKKSMLKGLPQLDVKEDTVVIRGLIVLDASTGKLISCRTRSQSSKPSCLYNLFTQTSLAR